MGGEFSLRGNIAQKAHVFSQAVRKVKNWPEVVSLRVASHRGEVRVLRFRNGLHLACRGGNLDWHPLTNVVLTESHPLALAHLRNWSGTPTVLDLGANVGFFSLLAAKTHAKARIISYEPAPQNVRMLELNRLLNADLSERIMVRSEAVGGLTRQSEFAYDENYPEASGLFYSKGIRYPVTIRAFSELVAAVTSEIALVKMDIEGAEYEVIERTPREIWLGISALTVELHPNHGSGREPGDFLKQIAKYGYRLRNESGPSSYFLSRD
jgi:FkbM family methyltransferase